MLMLEKWRGIQTLSQGQTGTLKVVRGIIYSLNGFTHEETHAHTREHKNDKFDSLLCTKSR